MAKDGTLAAASTIGSAGKRSNIGLTSIASPLNTYKTQPKHSIVGEFIVVVADEYGSVDH
ncbi:MAG: hypothetical protein PVF15_11065 [Candidatus Bathyarchaeota archaeon]|jgi:hypothetical protein